MNIVKMFVYGTLMEGFRNYEKYLKPYVIDKKEGYILASLYHLEDKNCPAIIEGSDRVYGEILSVVDEDGSVRKAVDELEFYFEGSTEMMYNRKSFKVYSEDGIEDLDVYLFVNEKYLHEHKIEKIPSGRWREYMKDRNLF
jgi:gamma-glutamylcyclotransferase (GGCT)/AIG2-like uncharacterized protein YtfP